jgi:hypothetical protein
MRAGKKKGFGTKPRAVPKNAKVQKCTPEKKEGIWGETSSRI